MSKFIRVERSGQRAVIDLASSLGVSADRMRISAIAAGESDTTYVLVETGGTQSQRRRRVVAVSPDGAVRWARDIDESELLVKDIARLASGDVLLAGIRPATKALATAILRIGNSGGQSPVAEVRTAQPAAAIYAASGTDGHAYIAEERNAQVFRVTSQNRVDRSFALASVSATARLGGIQMSGGRLASLHSDAIGSDPSVQRFVAVQDLDSGREVGLYGPVGQLVMCYRSTGRADEVTVLSVTREGWTLRRGVGPERTPQP